MGAICRVKRFTLFSYLGFLGGLEVLEILESLEGLWLLSVVLLYSFIYKVITYGDASSCGAQPAEAVIAGDEVLGHAFPVVVVLAVEGVAGMVGVVEGLVVAEAHEGIELPALVSPGRT